MRFWMKTIVWNYVIAENFLSYRKSKNGCFEINIELKNICDALFNDLIHKFVRFTNFAKI
jgi:hypothetical protein